MIDQTRFTNRVYVQTCERTPRLLGTNSIDSAHEYECGDGFSGKKCNRQGKKRPYPISHLGRTMVLLYRRTMIDKTSSKPTP